MAYPAIGVPAWKSAVSTVAAVLLAILWLASGVWKITDPIGWSARIIQLQLPPVLAMPATLGVGTLEIYAGILVLVPRFRRWGAILSTLLLVVFMIYIGANYTKLTGEECSCFPWLKRAVGPMFFVEDLALVGLAALAGLWAIPSHSRRSAILVLAAIVVFTGASYGVTMKEMQGNMAPVSITVDNKPFILHQGRVLVYFFDPQCTHCFKAAQNMQTYHWKDVRIVGVPWVNPQWGADFLQQTGFKASLPSKQSDIDLLKEKLMPEGAPPYAIALENGRQKQPLIAFEEGRDPSHLEPANTLRKIGWIE